MLVPCHGRSVSTGAINHARLVQCRPHFCISPEAVHQSARLIALIRSPVMTFQTYSLPIVVKRRNAIFLLVFDETAVFACHNLIRHFSGRKKHNQLIKYVNNNSTVHTILPTTFYKSDSVKNPIAMMNFSFCSQQWLKNKL